MTGHRTPQPGDGWVECACGRRHWGLSGAAGLLLVAGQAAATTEASARVGDRVGAQAGESSELAAIPLPLIFIGAAILVGFAVNEVVDNGESD